MAIPGGQLATFANAFWKVKGTPQMLVTASIVIASSLIRCSDASAQDAAGVYKEKCSGCHTIGGGDLVGPDLARTATWPDSEIEEGIKRMEPSTGPLSDAEVKALIVYLKTAKAKSAKPDEAVSSPVAPASSGSSPPASTTGAEKPDNSEREPASAERGRRLFYGDEAFKNGGLSCISCHSIDESGGSMAPDLTLIGTKMAPAALVSACEHTPYKVMKSSYKDHAILHQEALDLQAYLATLKEPHEKERKLPVGLFGGGLSIAILAVIAVGYSGKNKSVRSKLQRRD